MPAPHRAKPVIVITTGDPSGIGPEITEKALRHQALKGKAKFMVLGDLVKEEEMPGKPTALGGRKAVENIKEAVRVLNSLKAKKALVTAPINKYSLMKAGFAFKGHTELLAYLTNSKDVAMMFTQDHFRMALVTRHIPLLQIGKYLTKEKIMSTTRLFYRALKQFYRIKYPKIGIAALNPHGGESGVIGNEEQFVILPAFKRLKSSLNCSMILKPAEVLIRELYLKRIDGAVCMYHDQGLIPFKMLYFLTGVNVTLGLPFIRTSPDHGTAFDIAGRGKANPSSMIEAIKLAIKLASF